MFKFVKYFLNVITPVLLTTQKPKVDVAHLIVKITICIKSTSSYQKSLFEK